jgi:hypothetical protein
VVPSNTNASWVEAEAQLPDGRRAFAVRSYPTPEP